MRGEHREEERGNVIIIFGHFSSLVCHALYSFALNHFLRLNYCETQETVNIRNI